MSAIAECINPKVNEIRARLDFELVNYIVTARYASHYGTETFLLSIFSH